MSRLSATEAEFLLDAASAFFQGELRDFDGVDDHGVRVMGFGIRGVGEGAVGLVGGFHIPLSDVIHSFPLGLEGDGLFIPVVDGGGTVSIDMIRHIKGGGIPMEKYTIRTLALEMLARATWFLKVEMYSIREGE